MPAPQKKGARSSRTWRKKELLVFLALLLLLLPEARPQVFVDIPNLGDVEVLDQELEHVG